MLTISYFNMSAKHKLHIEAPIPSHIPPSYIIAELYDHNTIITLQSLTTGHKNLPSTELAILDDSYWLPINSHPVKSYEVTECIFALPGAGEWGKIYITFPSTFQNIKYGVKSRGDAPGVIVRAEFRVERSEQGPRWKLVEDMEVSCHRLLTPFVKWKVEEAHRGIVGKIIEKAGSEDQTDRSWW